MRWALSDAPYGERRAPSSRFLPPDPGVEAPYRLTPGLALRVGVLGVLALAVFAVLFFRLWSLQVLSGQTYLAAAQGNQLRTIRLEAPRGTILDRNGRVIVDNVPGTAVKLWVGDLPSKRRYEVIRRLAWVLNVRPVTLAKEVDTRVNDPLNPITVKTAVGEDQISYLYEHQADFPGVQIQQTYLRHYPYQSLGAQMLGYVGEVSQQELDAHPKLYESGDKVGKTGVESKFDEYLRGVAGEAQVSVDSMGRPHGAMEPKVEARPGSAVRLTIDIGLQRAAERALRFGIADGAGERLLQRGRRRARRARPAGRCRAGDGVDADVQAVRVRRSGRPEEDQAPRRRRRGAEGELPGDQPRDERRLPARLDLEARDGARGDAGALAPAVRRAPVHAERRIRPRQAGLQELGSRTSTRR